jgi:SAM-dependent methyltransferase
MTTRPADGTVFISLNPPYRLEVQNDAFTFLGWAEVNDPEAPAISVFLNGVEVPVVTFEKPGLAKAFPGMLSRGLSAEVRFGDVFAGQTPSEPFLLEATVVSDHRSRTFEYAASDAWLGRVFGRDVKARRVPPETLQIRVAGAAAGAFHSTGVKVAGQIAAILAANGQPLRSHARILDFGAGPGRVTASIRDLHPSAHLTGSDIDPEAIAWAAENLPEVGEFRVNAAAPPAPFADESFDLIYAISVFTHLPEDLQWAWLADLRRMLRPGGLLLTTKLNPAAYDLPAEVQAAAAANGFVYWGEATATDGLPDFYRLAYHSRDYVEREWGRYFEVLHVGAHDLNNTQDAVLLRRPRHALSWLPAAVRRRLNGILGRRS